MADEELIDGIYKLAMCIATGGSSQVWECIEQASGRHLAMKLLKQDSPDFKENKAGLKHEADVLKTLDHPLIVKFDRYSSSRDNTYMTMEHFRAPNVKLQLKSDMRAVHVRARKLFESVCQALSHVHSRGWIHRDVKPDNVLMNKAGEIRLVDFSLASKEVKGFSKMMGGGKLKTIQGTRTYIAPETIRKQAPTFQTDLYSLGIMFFEVLTGRTPFQAPTPEELLRRHLRDEPANASEFNSNVTQEMDRLILRLLKKKPADRPTSIDEVLGELRRIRIFKEDVTEAKSSEEEENSKSMDELTDIRLDSRADARLKQMLDANPELARQFAEEKKVKTAAKKAQAAETARRAQQTNDREAEKQAKSAKKKPGAAAQPQMMPQMMPQPMMPMPMPMMPTPFPPQPGFPQFPPQPQFGMPPAMPPGMMPPGAVPPGALPPMMPGAMPAGPPVFPNAGFPAQPAMAPGMMPPGMPPGMPPAPFPVVSGPMAPPAVAPPAVAQPPMPAPVQPPVTAAPVTAAPAARPVAPQPVTAAPPAAMAPAAAPPAKSAVPSSRPAPTPAKPASPPVNPDELEYMTELPDIL